MFLNFLNFNVITYHIFETLLSLMNMRQPNVKLCRTGKLLFIAIYTKLCETDFDYCSMFCMLV